MKEEKYEKIRAIFVLVLIIITILTVIYVPIENKKETYKFYDGNGKEIPYNIVDLLVKDQFVHLDSNEYKQLDKHFYYRKKKY